VPAFEDSCFFFFFSKALKTNKKMKKHLRRSGPNEIEEKVYRDCLSKPLDSNTGINEVRCCRAVTFLSRHFAGFQKMLHSAWTFCTVLPKTELQLTACD
jgi:hypothetical protein